MQKLNSEKGAVTLLVLVTVLFAIAALMGSYIIVANKAQTQLEMTAQVKRIYEQENAEDVYNNFIGDNIVPIYELTHLEAIGTDASIEINGKYYKFSIDATYVLKNDLPPFTDGNTPSTTWVPIGDRYDTGYTTKNGYVPLTGRFEGNGKTITVVGTTSSVWGATTYVFNMTNGYKYVSAPVPNPAPATFAYTGTEQTYTITKTGKYEIEIAGAEGSVRQFVFFYRNCSNTR